MITSLCGMENQLLAKLKVMNFGSYFWKKLGAKIHGSYERIEAGFAENVLRDLTGAPAEVIQNDDEEMFEKLL